MLWREGAELRRGVGLGSHPESPQLCACLQVMTLSGIQSLGTKEESGRGDPLWFLMGPGEESCGSSIRGTQG